MRTGRVVKKLINDVDSTLESEDAVDLLNSTNLTEVLNLGKTLGVGEYTRFFPDDMAVTHTVVTLGRERNNGTRSMVESDTAIVKFDRKDSDMLLHAVAEQQDLVNKLRIAHDAEATCNPLSKPEV